MNRRRMMMLQQIKPDLLEGYRLSHRAYKTDVAWQDNNTLTLKHTSAGFMGPENGALSFIGTSKQGSTSVSSALNNIALPTVELGKTYKLTLTVVDIITNTATAENDGVLTIAMGRGGGYTESYYTSVRTNFSELQIGDKFELVKFYELSNTFIAGAAFGFSNSKLLWDIKFKVEFEEV